MNRFIICVLALISISLPALATQQPAAPATAQAPTAIATPPVQASTSPIYIEPTLDHLADLYWSLGRVDLNSNDDVDNYMMIRECDIYLKYYHNDLEWAQVREAARQTISDKLALFSRKFEIMIPVGVGKYDDVTGIFPLELDSQRIDIKKFVVDYNSPGKEVCGYQQKIKNYPKNLVLLFSKPWTIKEFPVPAEKASQYIDFTREYILSRPDLTLDKQFKRYERIAYLRLKVTVMNFGDVDIPQYLPEQYASVYVNLDGYDVYADKEKKILLYSRDVEYQYPRAGKATP